MLGGAHIEQHVPKANANSPREAGEQKPQQNPTASWRQGKAQHHTDAGQQDNQEYVAASKPVEGSATDVAGEAFVLPSQGIDRKSDQEDGQQQPRAPGQEAWMKRMGYTQPEAEPYRQWQQDRINADQKQTTDSGGKAKSSLHDLEG